MNAFKETIQEDEKKTYMHLTFPSIIAKIDEELEDV